LDLQQSRNNSGAMYAPAANEKLFQATSLFDVRYRDIRFSPKASAPPDDARRQDTKTRRLHNIVPMIASGIGFNDKYR
jgi:hypothetical protein